MGGGAQMANWMTAEAISERYLVGETRLLEYAWRGNLPFRRQEGGDTLFDESVCARIFRPRVAGAITWKEPSGPHLGVLGVTAMGSEPRGVRRRAVRAPARDAAAPDAPRVLGRLVAG